MLLPSPNHYKLGCECFILNPRNELAKFGLEVDKGIFLGYSDISKAFRVFNSRTLFVEESISVKFNDGLTIDSKLSDLEDDFADMQIGPFIAPQDRQSKIV